MCQLDGVSDIAPVKPFPSTFYFLSSLPGLAFAQIKTDLIKINRKSDITESLTEITELYAKLVEVSSFDLEDLRGPLASILPLIHKHKETDAALTDAFRTKITKVDIYSCPFPCSFSLFLLSPKSNDIFVM